MVYIQVMRLAIALAFASIALAQTPDFSGVWKADLTASQFPGGHAPAQYLEIISMSGSTITEQTGTWFGQRNSRAEMVYAADGTPKIELLEGVPTRETGEMKDGKLVVSLQTDGQADTTTRTYEPGADGQKLTITVAATRDGHPMQTVLVLEKQPETAGDPLRQTPPPAATTFKNLKTPLKDLNSEEFIDHMHYFSWALGKNCEFCHVQRDFSSDDKKEKRTARAMISMTGVINQDTFKGKQEVSCYTCHQFHEHPQARPLFSGEKPRQHDESEEHDPETH